ncbi:MAG: hypothetical protein IKU36_10025, partial [Bacteroidales bacterium]|nr:hypothetical protein [Bacteroidales bacterium]
EDALEEAEARLDGKDAEMAATIQGLKNLCADFLNMIGENKDVNYEQAQKIAAIVADLAKLQGHIDAKVAELQTKDAELAAELAKANQAIVSTQVDLYNAVARIEALEKAIKTLADINYVNGLHNEAMNANDVVKAALNKLSKDIEEKIVMILAQQAADYTEIFAAIAAEAQKIATLNEAFTAYQELTDAEIDALKADDKALAQQIDDVQSKLMSEIEALSEKVGNTIQYIEELEATIEKANELLQKQIDALFARVQSLVYVPDFDDHKASIYYAELLNSNTNTFIARQSILRYRVNAKANESAEKAAADIAAAWKENPSILSFELEQVATRAAEASLEIAKVEAKGKDLFVYAVAKNFDSKFYESKLLGQLLSKDMYSTALVLSDGNNNISSAYTNLTAGEKMYIKAEVIDGEGKVITNLAALPEYLPYDSPSTEEVVVIEGHRLGFILNGDRTAVLTIDDMIAAGFDIDVKRTVYATGGGEENTHLADKDGVVREVGPFGIEERPFVSNNVEGDTYVNINKPVSKAQFDSMKEKEENILTMDFNYFVNGVKVTTTASVIMCNRLVQVEMDVNVPWTFETAMSTIDESGVIYAGNLSISDVAYNLNDAVKNNKSLEGYSLKTIIESASETGEKHNGGNYDIALQNITNETFKIRLKNGGTKYQFPANDNNDETNLVNTYSATWKTDFEDVTITVKVNMHLGEQAPDQILSNTVTFTPENGYNGWLFGYWNVLESAFKKFNKAGYILEESKDEFIATFADAVYATPLVDNEDGIAQNTNVAFKAGDHKFQLWHEQFDSEYINGAKKRIQQTVTPIFGTQFDFYVNGTVKLGDYALDLDPVRVVDGIVDVEGEIVDGVYTVDVSDLAKYYYVVNKSGEKSLTAQNEGDVLTVDFELSAMEGAEVTGFNFNNVVDQTNYTLGVDWTSATPYILDMGKAVAMWGSYPHTEVEVNAVLKVNGFPVASKPITLVTKDPLTITLNDVQVEVVNLSGTNADATVARVYQNFELYSAVEPEKGNLFNNEAKTVAGVFYYSKANVTYGATMTVKKLRVYYKDENGEIHDWDESKLNFAGLDPETDLFNGNISIKKDDGNIKTPIYVDVRVKMTHKIHDAAKTACETEGDVTITFLPEGYVAE